MASNKAFIFKKVGEGSLIPGTNLTVEARDFDSSSGPPSGGIIVKNLYASLDPYLRRKMRAPEVKDYSPPFQLGEPIVSLGVSKVYKSANSEFKEGDYVVGTFPVEQYTILSTAEQIAQYHIRKLENPHGVKDIRSFLGPLGMPGLTAFSSLYDIGKPKKGETIFISAASGAVGQVVGQLAKKEGLKVIGSVGSDKKLEYILNELGFDSGFNYKKESTKDALARLAPDGVDIYYENVGGETLDAALESMNDFGRIVGSGMISQYETNDAYGVKNLMYVVTKRLTFRGFVVSDDNMGPVYTKDHQEKVAKWINEGSIKVLLDETEGIERGPEGFIGMMEGKNFGKAILKIQDE